MAKKTVNENSELEVFDHQRQRSATMLAKAFEHVKNEVVTIGGRRFLRYTVGKTKVAAPKPSTSTSEN